MSGRTAIWDGDSLKHYSFDQQSKQGHSDLKKREKGGKNWNAPPPPVKGNAML